MFTLNCFQRSLSYLSSNKMTESVCLMTDKSKYNGWTTRCEKKFEGKDSLLESFRRPSVGVGTEVSSVTIVVWHNSYAVLQRD